MCFAATLSSVSPTGGHPTGVTALASVFRINPTASPSRKICTSCPASASANPCRKGNAALVGSSEPQALFITILSGLRAPCPPREPPAETKGSAANFANRDRNSRRIISFSFRRTTLLRIPISIPQSGTLSEKLHNLRPSRPLRLAQQRHRRISPNPRSRRRKTNIHPVFRITDHRKRRQQIPHAAPGSRRHTPLRRRRRVEH